MYVQVFYEHYCVSFMQGIYLHITLGYAYAETIDEKESSFLTGSML